MEKSYFLCFQVAGFFLVNKCEPIISEGEIVSTREQENTPEWMGTALCIGTSSILDEVRPPHPCASLYMRKVEKPGEGLREGAEAALRVALSSDLRQSGG